MWGNKKGNKSDFSTLLKRYCTETVKRKRGCAYGKDHRYDAGKPSKLLVSFALPVLIGDLFQQLYTLVDRVIVGQFVGADAFSAVGATNALSMMFMSMCMGTAIGTGVVVSQYFGAKDEENTAKAIMNGTYVNVIVAVIMGSVK